MVVSHSLPYKLNHRRADRMTESARNRFYHLLTLACTWYLRNRTTYALGDYRTLMGNHTLRVKSSHPRRGY